MEKQRLRVTEIFYSLQGETRTVGIPTVFIRLTGCPLRCQYCDTAYAFHGGAYFFIDQIIEKVRAYRTTFVTVTGGEPLAQPGAIELLENLCQLGYQVSLETSGAMSVSQVPHSVVKIIDVKTPGSNEVEKNKLDNFEYLTKQDQIKFVICHREDYEWSKQFMATHKLSDKCEILFSPSYQQLPMSILANWIVADQLPVRFQLQLHKILWGDTPGR